MKDKKMYILLVISILFAVIGVSLAFFSLNIIGNDTAKYNKITTGDLELVFTDDNEVSLDGAMPGDSITKTISVKNTGTKQVIYNLMWQELVNEITNNELVIEGTCKNLNSSNTEDGTCSSVSQKVVKEGKILTNVPIKPGYTQEYTIKITFIDTGKLQNYNKNKAFKGKLGLNESSINPVYCTYDGDLTQGAEYVNGQYTYRYMQEGSASGWQNIATTGWGVQLTNEVSTNAVTSKLCTYINNMPIVSMSYMFEESRAATIDLSSFDTSNVTNMSGMFWESQATILDLGSFDTSNVTNMSGMFRESQATILDLGSFDTSNVVTMELMFYESQAASLNLSNFDTSNVTSMDYMFYGSQVSSLDLNNFNTSNVTSMNFMFGSSQVTLIDLSNFDTSKVINMRMMFYASRATTLDLRSFDTSNVTNMNGMFWESKATTINLSSFDTKNVTDMTSMFRESQVSFLDLSNFDTSNVIYMSGMFYNSANLKTIYASDKFNTNKATKSTSMFEDSTNLVGGAGTKYDANHIDKEYARIDGGTSSPGYFTLKTN